MLFRPFIQHARSRRVWEGHWGSRSADNKDRVKDGRHWRRKGRGRGRKIGTLKFVCNLRAGKGSPIS